MVTRQILAIFLVVLTVCPIAYADKANDAYKLGMIAEKKADYDSAFEHYKQAYSLTPNNAKYYAAYTHMRFTAAMQHVHTGELLRNNGALTEAMAQFQRAAEIDGTNFIAQQEMRQAADLIHKQERQRAAPKPEPPPIRLPDGNDQRVELRELSNAPITLHMTADTDVAYKTICKLAGINVVMDPDYRPQKLTVDLNDVTLRQALDIVRLQSKTYWRPLLANTIFVTQDSAARRKESEQNVMRTFYLRNITSPTELQEAATVLRQILDVNRVQLLQGQDALIVRGTPDQLLLAEKLLSDIDKPKSEVVIDVVVMQVSRNRTRTLGTNVPTSVTVSYNPVTGGSVSTSNNSGGSSSGSGGSSSGSTSSGSNSNVLNIGHFSIPISSVTFTALATDSNTKILQNPEIRALNDQKATLKIGDRVPIATGSFQPGVAGAGAVSPLISTQFQYLDVGVLIDITPHIHSDREVTLKMTLEISSVTGSETIGGITQPVIGQRRIEHETRLADGEVNLLGGILEDTETQSMSGYPWISSIPLLRYLFAQDSKQRTENEIVFAVTPHIVRSLDVTDENLRVIAVGTGASIELPHTPATVAPVSQKSDPAKPQAADPQVAPAAAPAANRQNIAPPPPARK